MINTQEGTVQQIIYTDDTLQEIVVRIGEKVEKAINYCLLTGSVAEGDQVLLNTTACDLALGTGGWHFVMSGPRRPTPSDQLKQHIMKLRYTPFQMAIGSCEEQNSPFHGIMKNANSIEGMPVLVGELHSMLPIAATYINHKKRDLRLVYIQTDHGALPLSFSRHVRQLKSLKWIAGTISIGQGFGGDLEAINIYSGLVAAKQIMHAEIVMVSMGPGIAGTATKLGFSGLDQAHALHAAASLKGLPILIARVSEMDRRSRHNGISHHTKTVLEHTLIPVHVPILEEIYEGYYPQSLHHFHLGNRLLLSGLDDILARFPEPIYTMQRGFADDPIFYYSVALAADFAIFLATQTSGPWLSGDLSQKWKAWTTP